MLIPSYATPLEEGKNAAAAHSDPTFGSFAFGSPTPTIRIFNGALQKTVEEKKNKTWVRELVRRQWVTGVRWTREWDSENIRSVIFRKSPHSKDLVEIRGTYN